MADMSQTGMFYGKVMYLVTKYDFNISIDSFDKNMRRLINQLWKCIPMRENNEDWHKQLETVMIEVAGLSEIFYLTPQFLQLWSKLEGISKMEDLPFNIYRKTIFESITLMQEIKNELQQNEL